jgi:hypothetical protein
LIGGTSSWLNEIARRWSGRFFASRAREIIGVGETYDFELETPAGRRNLWLEVRSPAGKSLAQGHVIVK